MSGGEAKDSGKSTTVKEAGSKREAREAVVDALLRLLSRRSFADITISDIAREAGVSLADFRDSFPSKGAALAAFSRRIDRKVLDNLSSEHEDEPSRERLYYVLAARLKALEPYRDAVLAIADWADKDPLSAAALNREVVNSMRFMLEAADIDSEGPVGALKLQGLAFAWKRVLDAWRDDQPGETHRALAALDRELNRGEKFVDRAEDFARATAPLRSLANRLYEGLRGGSRHAHRGRDADDAERPHAGA
jgi:AcrR family transcriptional regulator